MSSAVQLDAMKKNAAWLKFMPQEDLLSVLFIMLWVNIYLSAYSQNKIFQTVLPNHHVYILQ